MSEALFRYYEGELHFIREMAKEFTRKYPSAAGRLILQDGRSQDPHVERLIEAFALLTGRIRAKIDDEFPELTDALLSVLYPHYLTPIPSLALLQFDLDQIRAKPPDGHKIAAGSLLQTPRVGDVPCKYRTCFPVTLWPITLTDAKLQPPPWPAGTAAPARAIAALRLRFESPPDINFAKQSTQRLRLFMHGDPTLIALLYEMIFNHTLQVAFRAVDVKGAAPVVMNPAECLFPVGFEKEESLLPYPKQSFVGYRLLTEFFAFPQKFHFVDLGGWDRLRAAGVNKQVEVVLFFNRTSNRLEQLLDTSFFRLGCTPAVNLFELTAEPIPLTQLRYEYKIKPDNGHPMAFEVHSVESVTGASSAGDRKYQPFYSFRHGGDRTQRQAFWYTSRHESLVEKDRGNDVYLNLIDLAFDPAAPADSVMVVRTLCSNRDLPLKIPRVGEEVRFETTFAAPLARIRCLRNPTAPIRPPIRRGAYWRLISHLSLNHLSISDPVEGLAALHEILRLYDFSDTQIDSQMASVNRQLIEGITSLKSRRVVGRVGGPTSSGFCRGVEIGLEFDEEKYVGTSMYLFAAVLERFLALYGSINSFVQLAARGQGAEADFKKWPPRAGEQPLL